MKKSSNEATMAKPAVAAMELPAHAEEDKEEATPLSNGPKAPTKASLQKLMHRLAEFKGSVPGSMAIAKSTQAQRTSLFKKSRKLNNSLAQQQEKLRSTEAELSKISKEEEELEIKIQNLISRKEKLLEHKKFTALQLENTNKMVSNNQAEQKELEGEIKQANENWYKAKEKLALANAIWKLFKECIEL
ncbi:hypothetical protein GH714_008355 [Hevea brasiliensis]|uniref:Uncharacterized protein n=1 Tax=Hevea brasiliensis TaxID=3981 RepID=A0A6A6L210_HEVBR|nr:hypothetical protein GH714_008355 [Hevea brasiliensis]